MTKEFEKYKNFIATTVTNNGVKLSIDKTSETVTNKKAYIKIDGNTIGHIRETSEGEIEIYLLNDEGENVLINFSGDSSE